MKKAIVILLVAVVSVFSIGCGEKEIPFYEGYDSIPDFGKYLESAELKEDEGAMLEALFNGKNKPKVYFYHIPIEEKEKAYEYTELLKENGFVSDGEDLSAENSAENYTNEEAGYGITISAGENTNDSSVFLVTLMIFNI